MFNKLEKVDDILNNLIDLASDEIIKAKEHKHFSKELAEACGIIISLAYGRWGNNDKSFNKYGNSETTNTNTSRYYK